uniref:Uncharacterized protein n=1 Tax=Streptomyces flaveolus TaxID=67297 RepID=H9TE83_9ACTN|nr:hypothetical protein [Streptomyces flaveolus]
MEDSRNRASVPVRRHCGPGPASKRVVRSRGTVKPDRRCQWSSATKSAVAATTAPVCSSGRSGSASSEVSGEGAFSGSAAATGSEVGPCRRSAAGPAVGVAVRFIGRGRFCAPAACWWVRTMVESTDTSQSIPPLHPGTHPVQHAVDHPAAVAPPASPCTTRPCTTRRQEPLQPSPFRMRHIPRAQGAGLAAPRRAAPVRRSEKQCPEISDCTLHIPDIGRGWKNV